MMKKWIAMMLALLIALSLAACGIETSDGKVTNPEGNDSNVQSGSSNDGSESDGGSQDQDNDEPAKLSDVLLNVHYEYAFNGEVQSQEDLAITYDEMGNKTHDIVWYEESNYSSILYAVYKYDEQGRLIWSDNALNQGWKLNWFYFYDDAGRLIRQDSNEVHTQDGVYISFEYDADGNMIHSWKGQDYAEYYTAAGLVQGPKCEEEWHCTYDGGNLTKAVRSWGGWTESFDYSYGANGLVSEMLHTSRYGSETLTTYTYNASGLLIKSEESYDSHGEMVVSRVNEYTYDAQGRILSHVATIGTSTTAVHTLTYSYGAYSAE